MDIKKQFMDALTKYLNRGPETEGGMIVPGKTGVRFGYPGGFHEPTSCWAYEPSGMPELTMLFDFFSNFTPYDLICKVIPTGDEIAPGAGASIQFNASRCVSVHNGNLTFGHYGQVNANGTISRPALVAGFRNLAPVAFRELGGDEFFSSWPVVLGALSDPGALLDNIFLYAYGVEQVKRAKRGDGPLPPLRERSTGAVRYWFTTHWPPEEGNDLDAGVFLADGTESVGSDVSPGDLVWIYESRTGRDRVCVGPGGVKVPVAYREGRRGVVALSRITGRMRKLDVPVEAYRDGSEKWWCWYASGSLVRTSGVVPSERAATLLGLNKSYNFRGFGKAHSGLMEIDAATHQAILDAYIAGQAPLPKVGKEPRRGGPGGEGPVHRALKERVAASPAAVLGEAGLKLVKMEFPFETGDRADIILEDGFGRFIGVEVEVEVDLTDLSGPLQAIKYSKMYAFFARRPYAEGRAFLVAHRISDEVKALCDAYEIEYFEVER